MKKEYLEIPDICSRYRLNETELAQEVGLSVSMISKLKNGGTVLTEETRGKFQKKFPNIILVAGKEHWKLRYQEKEKEVEDLNLKIKDLEAVIEKYQRRFKQINRMSKDIDVNFSIRGFGEDGNN